MNSFFVRLNFFLKFPIGIMDWIVQRFLVTCRPLTIFIVNHIIHEILRHRNDIQTCFGALKISHRFFDRPRNERRAIETTCQLNFCPLVDRPGGGTLNEENVSFFSLSHHSPRITSGWWWRPRSRWCRCFCLHCWLSSWCCWMTLRFGRLSLRCGTSAHFRCLTSRSLIDIGGFLCCRWFCQSFTPGISNMNINRCNRLHLKRNLKAKANDDQRIIHWQTSNTSGNSKSSWIKHVNVLNSILFTEVVAHQPISRSSCLSLPFFVVT